MPSPIIETSSLSRSYGPRRGITDISLSIPEGSIYGFLGPNGAGKTTTIRVLLGFLRPTAGRAAVFGADCWKASHAIKVEVGYVPGDLRLHSWMTGRDALRLFGAIRKRDLGAEGRDLAQRFELDLSVKVQAMSRGMRQKLGLILAFAPRPRLLVLDEPSSALDPLMQDRFRDLLRTLASRGHTIFFSSHTLSEVEQLCDRVAIVRDGRLVADATLSELQARAGHDVTIRWKTTTDEAAPPFLRIDRREPMVWHASLDGPVAPLIAWLAARSVDDIAISRPDLESLFRRYYQEPTP